MTNPVEAIKEKANVVDEISRFVDLKQAGNRWTGMCPFHANVNTPSFYVFPENGSWYCFGECSEGGDLFTFLQKVESKTFSEVLEDLSIRYNVTISKDPEYTAKMKQVSQIQRVNDLAAQLWHTNLIWNPEALGYLQQRGITMETIESFRLGLALDSWTNLMDHLNESNIPLEDIISTSLVRKGKVSENYYDFFRDRITIPIQMNGGILGFGARVTPNNDSQAKFINTSETAAFKKREVLFAYNKAKSAIRETKTAVIVEGYFDAITLHQEGITNVVACAGTAVTKEQIRALKQAGAEKIILALDGDTAGEKASVLIATQLKEVDLYIASLPEGKDPDELVLEDKGYLLAILDNAEPFISYLISIYSKGDSPADKKNLSKKILPLIDMITDPTEQAAYLEQLAEALKIKNFRPNPRCPHCKKRQYTKEEQETWKSHQ